MDPRDEFLTLFLRHQGDLRAFLGALLTDPHQRDDVFQEVALVLWKQFDDYDRARSFGAWARGIAANKVLQTRERLARSPVALAPDAIHALLDAFARTEEEQSPDRADALRRCLERLPDHSRQLLAQRYEKGLDVGEIARQLGRSLDSTYQALSRVRARLEDCIRQRLADER